MSGDRPRVSLSMIVKDGAETLARCLNSVAGLVAETVVVDTGSTDDSRAIAARLGARVVPFTWTDSFADARNESLRQVVGDWVVWLDHDEWLDDHARTQLRALIDQLAASSAVYFFRQVSPVGTPGAGPSTVYQPRLFRNGPDVRWHGRVHEQVLSSCLARGDRPLLADVAVLHSGYESAAVARGKEARNLRLVERDLADRPDDPWLLFQQARLLVETRFPDARSSLLRALRLAPTADPLRRQLACLLARGLRENGLADEARIVVAEALSMFPTDTRLLVESATIAARSGSFAEAEAAFTQLLSTAPDPDEFFGPVDLSWRGWQARHHLALLYLNQNRLTDAEALARAGIAENPAFAPLWLVLCELYLAESRLDDFDSARDEYASLSPNAADEVLLLRARGHLGRGEFPLARSILLDVTARHPSSSWPILLLSRSYLHEGTDLTAAERALRAVLAIDPENMEARKNLLNLMDYLAEDDDPFEVADAS